MLLTKVSPSFEKVTEIDLSENKTDYHLCMAKNESESCVISLFSSKGVNNVNLEVKDTNKGINVELEVEETININGKAYPDPLVPLNDFFNLERGRVKNILVRFTTCKDTDPGEHRFVLHLKDREGNIFVCYVITVKVWDFSLPEERTVETSVGLSYDALAFRLGITDKKTATPLCPSTTDIPMEHKEAADSAYKTYYDFLLDNRVCAYYLPYDILDDRADAYMSDPRVTTFKVQDNVDDETLVKYYNKLCSNDDWKKKAYLYPFDEPTTKEHIDIIKERVARLKKLCPDIRCTSPFYWNAVYDENNDEVEMLLNNLDLMCPKIVCWNDKHIYRFPGQYERFGSFGQRMKKAQQEGKQIWQYVCWEPGKPYVNLYVNEEGLDHRVLFWQQYKVGATGFLYWRANFWREVDDPWTDMATVPGLSRDVYGDGSLLYPGDKVGIEGPCGSLRLEIVKDGIEDCELLNIAEKLLGKEWVESKVSAIVLSVTEYTENSELFIAIRNEIGNAVEKAVKHQL